MFFLFALYSQKLFCASSNDNNLENRFNTTPFEHSVLIELEDRGVVKRTISLADLHKISEYIEKQKKDRDFSISVNAESNPKRTIPNDCTENKATSSIQHNQNDSPVSEIQTIKKELEDIARAGFQKDNGLALKNYIKTKILNAEDMQKMADYIIAAFALKIQIFSPDYYQYLEKFISCVREIFNNIQKSRNNEQNNKGWGHFEDVSNNSSENESTSSNNSDPINSPENLISFNMQGEYKYDSRTDSNGQDLGQKRVYETSENLPGILKEIDIQPMHETPEKEKLGVNFFDHMTTFDINSGGYSMFALNPEDNALQSKITRPFFPPRSRPYHVNRLLQSNNYGSNNESPLTSISQVIEEGNCDYHGQDLKSTNHAAHSTGLWYQTNTDKTYDPLLSCNAVSTEHSNQEYPIYDNP